MKIGLRRRAQCQGWEPLYSLYIHCRIGLQENQTRALGNWVYPETLHQPRLQHWPQPHEPYGSLLLPSAGARATNQHSTAGRVLWYGALCCIKCKPTYRCPLEIKRFRWVPFSALFQAHIRSVNETAAKLENIRTAPVRVSRLDRPEK